MILQRFLSRFRQGVYIGDFVYGANDGIVTTFAVVAGATGALLSSGVVLILGLASLAADAFSMGASSFLAIRAEKELERTRKREAGQEPPRNGMVTPFQHASVTFVAFMTAGAVPLVPYFFAVPRTEQFLISALAAALTFFAVGGVRTFITGGHFAKGGFEVLLVGGVASGVAFGIGWGIKTLFGIAV